MKVIHYMNEFLHLIEWLQISTVMPLFLRMVGFDLRIKNCDQKVYDTPAEGQFYGFDITYLFIL